MRIILIVITAILLSAPAQATFIDLDGRLEITWSPPQYGTDLDYYIYSYNINGITDSVTGTASSSTTSDNSVQLINTGDWAVFEIQSVSNNGDTSIVAYSDTVKFSLTVDIDEPELLPESYSIDVYPNPVQTSQLSLNWKINQSDNYRLEIYDILGRKVKTVRNQTMSVGEYDQNIANDFAPGVYFAVITGNDDRRVVKFTVIR